MKELKPNMTKSNFKEKSYIGKNGYIFCLETQVGSGGNGEVYKVKLINDENDSYYAVKFFNYKGPDKNKRYERFKREIEAVYNRLSDVDGVMKIIDYYLPDNLHSEDKPWYLMPLARKLPFCEEDFDKKTIINYFLQLAYTIKEIHDKGMCHRDIKPDNILLIDDKIYLSDFGLVLFNDKNRITDDNERIGPYVISPPEYYQPNKLDIEELKYGDVYLFAKTLWIYIKKDKRGFTGEYNLADKSLRLSVKNVDSLYPINLLIENATKDVINDRIDINKCIELLKEQVRIIDHKINKELLNNYILCENVRISFNDIKQDYTVYSNKDKIYELLKKVAKYSIVEIISKSETIKKFSPIKIKRDNDLLFFVELRGKEEIEYKVKIEHLKYVENRTIDIKLERLSDNEKSGYSSLRECI